MRNLKLLVVVCICMISCVSNAQQSEINNIKNVITEFAKAMDDSDPIKLSTYLDDNYRIIMNRIFGKDEVVIMPKMAFLQKIETKEFGGDQRVVTFFDITINKTIASVKVNFEGKKANFTSIITLIKDLEGNWKLIGDTPIFIKN